MIPFETFALFLSTSVALAMAPGPDNIFVLTQSALNGQRAGLTVMVGLFTGVLVHTLAVAFGVAMIFATSEMAFNALKFLGAAYLLYLAWGAFRTQPTEFGRDGAVLPDYKALYWRGVIMNITNPKVAIFFLAFLPQFADPAVGPIWVQIIQFGLTFIVGAVIVFGTIAVFAGGLGNWLRKTPKAQIILNRVAGVVFVGLAMKLLSTKQ